MRPIENRVIVLVIHDDKIFYCNHHFILESELEGKLSNKFTMSRVTSFDSESGLITVKIEGSRQLDKDDYLANSKANAEFFERVKINKIRLFSRNGPIYQQDNNRVKTYSMPDKKPSNVASIPDFLKRPTISERLSEEELDKVIQLRRQIPLVEATFGDGAIIFTTHVREASSNMTITIPNTFVRPEYNSIKKYFAAQLERGNADILCEVKYKGAEILESQVISHNLSSINEETLSNIEDDLIQDYIIDFDSDEFRSLEDSLKDVYQVPEDNIQCWLISKLSKESLTKHHEHLMYLSGLHERELFPLKVTGKPISFLFGFRKANRTFIIWETHNTKEATYIWRIDAQTIGNFQYFVSEKENLVKSLRQGHKRTYRSDNKTNNDFKVIEHDYSLPQNGFERWRSAVEEYMNSN